MLEGIPELRLVNKAIHNVHITPLSLECPKHSIPNNQHRPIILVQTISICPMVNLNISCSEISLTLYDVKPCGGWLC